MINILERRQQRKIKSRAKRQALSRQKRIPNAMIVVEKTKKRVFRYVPDSRIPFDSFPKKYNKRMLHILGLDLEGKYWPLDPPKLKEGRSPVDLYTALTCAYEVNNVYGQDMPTIEKIKIGILVGLCIAILVIIFLMVSASGAM